MLGKCHLGPKHQSFSYHEQVYLLTARKGPPHKALCTPYDLSLNRTLWPRPCSVASSDTLCQELVLCSTDPTAFVRLLRLESLAARLSQYCLNLLPESLFAVSLYKLATKVRQGRSSTLVLSSVWRLKWFLCIHTPSSFSWMSYCMKHCDPLLKLLTCREHRYWSRSTEASCKAIDTWKCT